MSSAIGRQDTAERRSWLAPRPPRARLLAALLALASCAPLPPQPPPPPDPAEPDSPAPIPFTELTRRHTITLSGGVSLGAYEGGYLWGLIRFMRQQRRDTPAEPFELVALAGSSVGNINAFLVAEQWCQDDAHDEAETPERNILWQMWMPVSWERLMPEEHDCARYARETCEREFARDRPLGDPMPADDCVAAMACDPHEGPFLADDALLARRAFGEVQHRAAARLGETGRYRACELPIGVSLSRLEPRLLRVRERQRNWDTLALPTQRAAVLLEARSRPGQPLQFRNRPAPAHAAALVGEQLLVGDGSQDELVTHDTLLALVKASSAFPGAFGTVKLRGRSLFAGFDERSPLREDTFFDGAVFDKKPLGLALALSTSAQGPAATHWVLDPLRRRHRQEGPGPEPPRGSLASLMQMIASATPVVRTYEMQIAARIAAEWPVQFQTSTRYTALMGEHLSAFGAFFARAFRQADYYAGLYDAFFQIADARCAQAPADGRPRCLVERFRELHERLHIERSPAATAALRLLLRHELSPLARACQGSAAPPCPWLHEEAGSLPPVLRVVIEENLAAAHRPRSFLDQLERIHERISRLPDAALDAELSPTERRMFATPWTFFSSTSRSVASRLVALEEQALPAQPGRARDTQKTYARSALALQALLYSYTSDYVAGPSLDLDPSSIPGGSSAWKNAAHLLPTSITFDVVRGGVELAHRPTLHLHERLAIVAPTALLSQTLTDHRLSARLGLGLAYKTLNPALNSIELGPFVSLPYLEQGNLHTPRNAGLGAELSLNAALQFVRLSVGANDLLSTDGAPRTVMVRLGFSNLNGLIYWAGSAL